MSHFNEKDRTRYEDVVRLQIIKKTEGNGTGFDDSSSDEVSVQIRRQEDRCLFTPFFFGYRKR